MNTTVSEKRQPASLVRSHVAIRLFKETTIIAICTSILWIAVMDKLDSIPVSLVAIVIGFGHCVIQGSALGALYLGNLPDPCDDASARFHEYKRWQLGVTRSYYKGLQWDMVLVIGLALWAWNETDKHRAPFEISGLALLLPPLVHSWSVAHLVKVLRSVEQALNIEPPADVVTIMRSARRSVPDGYDIVIFLLIGGVVAQLTFLWRVPSPLIFCVASATWVLIFSRINHNSRAARAHLTWMDSDYPLGTACDPNLAPRTPSA